MDGVFDPAKDAANRAKHGVPLVFGTHVFADREHIVFAAIRSGSPQQSRRDAYAMEDQGGLFRSAERLPVR
jgi:uncharacterized DUF497 family protein